MKGENVTSCKVNFAFQYGRSSHQEKQAVVEICLFYKMHFQSEWMSEQ